MSDSLLIEINSNVAEIEINRPDHANALNEELWYDIGECFSELDENKSVRVCIISGVGSNFSSGIDLNLSGCALFSTTYIIADEKNRAMAKR